MTIQIKSGLAGIQPVYICYGAPNHTLRVKGAEDSPWVGHGASLNHAAGDSSLVAAEPGYGELQKLGLEGAQWKLICPANGTDRNFEYWIQSEFTAAPCKIPMRLGHYRREILDRRSPIRAPVKGDTVTAEITVGSFYTKQVLEGVEVKWSIDGTTVTVPTTASGVSQFTVTVQTLGEQKITAEFHSPYDDKTVKESFEINVYETSPWKEAKLFVKDMEMKWGDPIVLTRGSANTVRVDVVPEIAKVLRLELGEPGGLNLVSNPPFKSDVSPVGETFNWTVTPDDGLSGLVTLFIYTPNVELPWELPCWVMTADLADEVDEVLVGGVPYPLDGIVLFRDEPQTLTLKYKAGSPVQGWPLQMTATLLTGLQDGDLTVTSGEAHKWTIKASNRSGTFKLELVGVSFAPSITLPVSKVLSRILADEVTVQIDGKDAVAGSTYFRGEVHTLTLVPKPGSPIAGHMIGLWLGRSALVSCDPPQETFTGVHTWTITFATDKSGLFHFELAAEHFGGGNIKIDANKLFSRNLADEVTVQIDGNDAVAGRTYFRRDVHTLTLVPKPGSPIGAHRAGVWLGGSTLVTCDPPAETFTGVHTWKVMLATDRSGLFHFELVGEHFDGGSIKIDANKLMSRDLADEVTSFLLDGVAISPAGADFKGGEVNRLSLDYKNADVLIGAPISLELVYGEGVDSSDINCTPPFSQLSTTHNWVIKSSKHRTGTFRLKISTTVGTYDGAMLTPVNRLKPDYTGTTLKFQAGVVAAPVPPERQPISLGFPYGIIVRLHFQGGAPVVGMPVKIVVPGKGTYEGKTLAGGGFLTPYIVFTEAGVRTVTAEATLSDGTRRSATVLLDVRSGAGE